MTGAKNFMKRWIAGRQIEQVAGFKSKINACRA